MERYSYQHDTRDAPHSGRRGAALLLLVLLIAVSSTAILNAQISTAMALRHARAKTQSNDLRIAAADASWYALRKLASNPASSPGTLSYSEDRLLPSLIQTRIRTSSANSLGAAALALTERGMALKDLTMVMSEASVSGATERVMCVVAKKNGKLRVLGWYEEM